MAEATFKITTDMISDAVVRGGFEALRMAAGNIRENYPYSDTALEIAEMLEEVSENLRRGDE